MIPNKPLTDNPTTCSGTALRTTLEVQTYQDPEHLSRAESSYPALGGCESETFKPVLEASPTTSESDAPSGLNLELGRRSSRDSPPRPRRSAPRP